jgi:hypothetical protein
MTVPNGQYTITLRFAEICPYSHGGRSRRVPDNLKAVTL